MKDNSDLQRLTKQWQIELNNVIDGWNLIPGCPKDEFDSLTNKLISHLTRGTIEEKIYNILEGELISRYGLSPTATDLKQFTTEVTDWWSNKE